MDPFDKSEQTRPTNFDPVAEIYDETRDSLSHLELSALAEELKGAKTLEIAVGTGRLAKPLQERGIDLTGIDISEKMLSRSKAKQTRNLVRAEGSHLPFRDRMFDIVLVAHFLHLVPNWPTLLREITRVASDRLVSVDSRTVNSPRRPREIYLDKLKQRGYAPPVKHAGELLLADMVPPQKKQLISKMEKRESIDKMVEMLEKRWLAVSWTVPQSLHEQVIQDLKREVAGREDSYTVETFLLAWTVRDLNDAIPRL